MLPCSTPWSNSGHGLNTVAYAITHRITSGNSTAEPKKNSTASDEVANECDRSGTLATCPKADINYLTCNNRTQNSAYDLRMRYALFTCLLLVAASAFAVEPIPDK